MDVDEQPLFAFGQPDSTSEQPARLVPGGDAGRGSDLRPSEREPPGLRRECTDDDSAINLAHCKAIFLQHAPAKEALETIQTAADGACLGAAVCRELSNCPQCGDPSSSVVRYQRVVVVSLQRRHALNIEIKHCQVCQAEYSLDPLQLGCIATSKRGRALTTAVASQMVLWLDINLVRLLGLLVSMWVEE